MVHGERALSKINMTSSMRNSMHTRSKQIKNGKYL